MSEFLMVVPTGWTEITDMEGVFQTASADSIQQIITEGAFFEIEKALDFIGIMPIDQSIWDARIFSTGSSPRLWVKFGALR